MTKVWRIKEKTKEDIIEQLLLNRGLKTEEEEEKFFNCKISDYEKDLEIPGIEKTLVRIRKSIELGELIIVFGDYDVDGVSASAILYKGLTSIGAKVLPYIPHREKEGYGLSKLGLDFARDSGASLVITVDNGIVAFEEAEYAKSIGLDLIITDHHTLSDKKPDTYSIVHSTKICGAAVAWALIRNEIKKDLADELLEFVAVATIADMMPLLGINRALVKEGLVRLNKTKNLGFLALFKESKIEKGSITSYEIGHIIAPRINAIGRLEHAIDALRMLCTKDEVKAKKLAKLLSEANTKRQEFTAKAYDEAQLVAEKNINAKIHVLFSADWHPGIIGLVAARITQKYSVPSIAISVGKETAKGSARSVNGINITELLRSCEDLLVDIGGHAGAAGFSIVSEKISVFKNKIEKEVIKLDFESDKDLLEIECEIPFSKITKTLVKKIEEFGPFGMSNQQPLLASNNMKISDIRTVGAGKHLKFKVTAGHLEVDSGPTIDAIAFNMGELESFFQAGQLANVAYLLEINKFNGRETLQLKVRDIQLS